MNKIQPGITLKSRYCIIKSLGKGGFGDTYLAQDEDLPGKPKCVVKHLRPKLSDPGILPIAQTLFKREANTLDKLGKYHQQIPELLAHFQEEGEFYLVQQYIDGEDISKELIPGKKLSASYTVKLLKNILEVLVFVHQENVIHRDIKPQNLMRRRQDNKIVLIDFGAVKEISTLVINAAGDTSVTVAVGTPGYMPSEQAIGKPKFSSDVYAVGIIGIQALTGKKPHQLPEDMSTGNILWRDKAEVSEELGEIIDQMVRDHFSQRYQDAAEALEALMTVNIEVEDKSASEFPPLITSTQTFTTVTVNGKGEIIERRQDQAQVIKENLSNDVILEMVLVPGGRFLMGSPDKQVERTLNETPQHHVDISSFFLGKYPVTQVQWEVVMGNNPSFFKGANLPVESVSWNDAIHFCQRLSQMTGKNYRLPTEAEWEYACRAGTSTPFYFGETITTELANYNGNYYYASAPKGIYRKKTTDVGSFPPNNFGLYDMHGNVWEWCKDDWHDNYDGAPTDGSAWLSGDDRYSPLRGGSWVNDPDDCRSATRSNNIRRVNRYIINGFRVVCGFGRTL